MDNPFIKQFGMKNNPNTITIRSILISSLLIPALLLNGCVAKFTKKEDGSRSLVVRDRDPMKYDLDIYFRNAEKKIDTLHDHKFWANTIWILVNRSKQPITLSLRYDTPNKQIQTKKYDFPLNKKTNKISFFRMKMGTYTGELKKGDLIRRFKLEIDELDL